MIHFIVHISNETEAARLPSLQEQLQKCFPESRLHVLNQTTTLIEGATSVDNTKSCGFDWTLRFLRFADEFLQPEDVVIKIDPDIDIFGNPLQGLIFSENDCFGQIKFGQKARAFMGGFQGYTSGAVKLFLQHGQKFGNETGAQDRIAYRVLEQLSCVFVAIPHIDLWASKKNYDACLKIRHWSDNE